MNDKLKQFIDSNREAFDASSPTAKPWEKIAAKLPGTTAKSIWRKPMLWAASLTGILLVSVTVFVTLSKNNTSPSTPKEGAAEFSDVTDFMNPVYTRQIQEYKEVIGLQQTELKLLEKEQPDLYRQFLTDIAELDSAYRVLKTRLPGNPNRELLIEAMIQNLQWQSDLLNRQLQIIKDIKQKSKAHEKHAI